MGGRIRVGIGGWVFPDWRGTFYPEGLRQKDELAYVGRHMGATEINATYYSRQKPESFAASPSSSSSTAPRSARRRRRRR